MFDEYCNTMRSFVNSYLKSIRWICYPRCLVASHFVARVEKAIEIWTRGMEFWPFVIRIIASTFPSISIIPNSIHPCLQSLNDTAKRKKKRRISGTDTLPKYSCLITIAIHLFHLRGIIASSLLVVETKHKATTRKQRARCQRSPAFQSAHFSNF